MGKTSIFEGKSKSSVIKEIYGQSAELFADSIRSRLPERQREYTLLDIGSSKGELLRDLLKLLPEYHFNVTVTDINAASLAENHVTTSRLEADAELLPLEDHSQDVILMRYVLQFNGFQSQMNIIKEITRVTRKFAVIQHAGSDNESAEEWRAVVDQIFKDGNLPQLNRQGMFWSSALELENSMKKDGVKFEKIQEKRVEGLSEVYTQRYQFNDEQKSCLKKILADKDYITITTWVIYPK